MFSNSVYDKLKFATQVGLPAAGSLYFGLSQIWGYPNGEEVVGTIALVTTFFGVLLGVSSSKYPTPQNAGDLVVEDGENGKKVLTLDLGVEPMDIMDMDAAAFTVVRHDQQADEEFWPPQHLAD